jgi:hypothetical protein
MNKGLAIVLVIVLSIMAIGCIGYLCVPSVRAAMNTWFFHVQQADDVTSYQTKQEVEDTCRAMISSYVADKLAYEGYKDERPEWAAQTKARANRTASTYNNYILRNKFVWQDNVPADIYMELAYIE